MKSMKLVLSSMAMLVLSGQATWGAVPGIMSEGHGSRPYVPPGASVLWVDPPNLDGNIVTSEEIGAFEFESELAGDLFMTAGTTVHLARWWGGYYGCTTYPSCEPHVTGFRLGFYQDAGCIPGSLIAEYILPTNAHETLIYVQGGTVPIYEYWANVQFTAPTTGVYWFSVQALDHPYPPQWGRLAAMQVRSCDSMFKSAFFGYPDWTPVVEVTGAPYDASQAFESLPEPTPLIRNYCPPAWQGAEVNWSRDVAPRNRVDDLIDAAPTGYFDIIVNFRRCVETADINDLNALSGGGVQMVYEYITSVAVGHVTEPTIRQIAALSGVAFIEKQLPFQYHLDVSVPALKVTASTYSPTTVADCQPGINGTGVNVVIMDSGVDNPGSTGAGPFHQAFAATPVIAGYDCVTSSYLDPNDQFGHGTFVASIALAQATSGTSRGMAPGAGLIDVRLSSGSSIPPSAPPQALQIVYNNRSLWNVKVINMSFGLGAYTNGIDSFSQLCDLAEAMGIVIVTAAGNAGPTNAGLDSPAAATRVITVAGSDDLGTISRTNPTPDVIWASSSKGPRSSDGDFDCIDELKPEVTAPGSNITGAQWNTLTGPLTRSGTSMAAPHVTGLAALIIQAFPTINPASVKDRIIKSCQQLGTTGMSTCDPTWSDRWGWGLVDAYAAVCTAPSSNPTFPNCPANPGWLSMDLSTNPSPPHVGQPCTVTAMITNPSPSPAFGVKVGFGIHDYSSATPAFYDIGTTTVNLAANQTTPVPVSTTWTPLTTGHQCLYAEIGYAFDSNYGCNSANRNLTVAQSPVTFRVQNTITEDARRIYFVPTFEHPDSTWDVQITPPDVVMGADDCPQEVTVLLIPVTAAPGDSQIVHVAARMDTPEYGTVELGGVSVLDVNEGTGGIEGGTTPTAVFGLQIVGGNPFRTATTIQYTVTTAGPVKLGVYDVKGRMVASLVDGFTSAGEHTIAWDAHHRDGRELAPGVYFLRLESGGRTSSHELVLMK